MAFKNMKLVLLKNYFFSYKWILIQQIYFLTKLWTGKKQGGASEQQKVPEKQTEPKAFIKETTD